VPKFPEPPDPELLALVPPTWHDLAPGTGLWRVYFRDGDHPAEWDTFRAFGPVNRGESVPFYNLTSAPVSAER
jgi:hypothetical protein